MIALVFEKLRIVEFVKVVLVVVAKRGRVREMEVNIFKAKRGDGNGGVSEVLRKVAPL